MIPFGETLDTIDFDALVAIARSRLPGLAPQWTDYNIHDPGITLTELVAWVADAQVYALARNRGDERAAMARLLGAPQRGAKPATGFVVPADVVEGIASVAAATRLIAIGGAAPRVETATDVTLLPVEIAGVRSEASGVSIDLTAANRRAQASFAAFGPGIVAGATLRIILRTLSDAAWPAGEPVLLSLGFSVDHGDVGRGDAALGGIAAETADGVALRCPLDTTDHLQRSGVMVLALPADADRERIEIVLRRTGAGALMPRLRQIAVNALPVRQQASFRPDLPVPGNGRPGQTIAIVPASLFAADEPADGRVWRLVDWQGSLAFALDLIEGTERHDWHRGGFDDAGPDARAYTLDERADGGGIIARFGNGINGRVPGEGDGMEVSLRLSCGAGGNVSGRLEWLLDGYRSRWENIEPIAGGRDAESPDDALAVARLGLAQGRVFATAQDIVTAAADLPASFGIVRSEVEDGWERGRRTPLVPATRTLIVARSDRDGETAAWRRAILRRLAPHIPLGERLLVVSPVYRAFGMRAEVRIAVGRDPKAVRDAVQAALTTRFAGDGTALKPFWPMGRDVDATAIGGWLRRVEGVAAILSVTISGDGLDGDRLPIGRGELPELADAEIVIVGSGR